MNANFTLASQLETPIVESVDGVDIEFPRLVMADLTAWAAAIQNKRLADAQARAKAEQLSPFERQRLLQVVADQDVELENVVAKAYTPAGVTKALVLSLKKTGKSDEQALAVLARIHFRRQAVLMQTLLAAPDPDPAAAAESPEPKGDGSENPPGDSTGT